MDDVSPEDDTIVVHQYRGAWGLPSCSPFCLKLQTYLRMTQIGYRTAPSLEYEAPRDRLPYIVHGSRVVADTQTIIEYLHQVFGVHLDTDIPQRQLALGHVIRMTIEESLYFANLFFRWTEEKNLEIMSKAAYVGVVVELEKQKAAVREGFRQRWAGRPIAYLSAAEVAAKARADIESIAQLLGDSDYLVGSRPSTVDASAYGLFANVLWAPIESPVKAALSEKSNLVRYCDRIRERWFG